MTEHLMLWIVSYTFLEMSTNWLSSNRCAVFLLMLSNAIFTWLTNSGITILKRKHQQNSVSIKRIKRGLSFWQTASHWLNLIFKQHYWNNMISIKWEHIYNFYHSDKKELGMHASCGWLYSTTNKKKALKRGPGKQR